jgi:hypothetical protein
MRPDRRPCRQAAPKRSARPPRDAVTAEQPFSRAAQRVSASMRRPNRMSAVERWRASVSPVSSRWPPRQGSSARRPRRYGRSRPRRSGASASSQWRLAAWSSGSVMSLRVGWVADWTMESSGLSGRILARADSDAPAGSVQHQADQPVGELGLEPGGLGRHDLAPASATAIRARPWGGRHREGERMRGRRRPAPRGRRGRGLPPTKSMRSSRRGS